MAEQEVALKSHEITERLVDEDELLRLVFDEKRLAQVFRDEPQRRQGVRPLFQGRRGGCAFRRRRVHDRPRVAETARGGASTDQPKHGAAAFDPPPPATWDGQPT